MNVFVFLKMHFGGHKDLERIMVEKDREKNALLAYLIKCILAKFF